MSEPTNDILATLPQITGPLVKHDEAAFEAVSKSGDYLARLQIMGSNSDLVKEGKIEQGVIALVHDNSRFKNLGKSLDMLSVTWRPKALDLSTGTPISHFDPASDGFKNTQKKAMQPDSGCMFGPEFLVWIPSQEEFATFFMGSKTARKEGPNLLTLMKKDGGINPAAATLQVKFIKGQGQNRYSWHGPQIIACTTPLTVPPDPEDFVEQVEKFNNPPASAVEAVAPAAEGARAR